MTTMEVARALQDLIDACEIPEEFCPVPIRRVQTYEEAGMLTRDAGFVVTLTDGSEFQITVVQSLPGHR